MTDFLDVIRQRREEGSASYKELMFLSIIQSDSGGRRNGLNSEGWKMVLATFQFVFTDGCRRDGTLSRATLSEIAHARNPEWGESTIKTALSYAKQWKWLKSDNNGNWSLTENFWELRDRLGRDLTAQDIWDEEERRAVE